MQLFAMAWSPDGKQLATIGRDHVIRIYDPRNSTSPVNEGRALKVAGELASCGSPCGDRI